ncbi:hypothetical protein LV779_08220 [Streptomyces thinghirensis]|nr:hypothetical protein [Streptomyces thinghirensis]
MWTLIGWQNNPSTQIIDAVDKSKLLIVDGLSDRYNGLDREATWHDAPYAFGTIPNFGGHTTVGANTAVWAERFDQWRTKPGSSLSGIAYMPEGHRRQPGRLRTVHRTGLAYRPAGPPSVVRRVRGTPLRRCRTRTPPGRGSCCAPARTARRPGPGASPRTACSPPAPG